MNEIDILINKFDNIKDTHPQLYIFWKNYLLIKKERIKLIVDKANSILETIDEENDISIEKLQLVYSIIYTLSEDNDIY